MEWKGESDEWADEVGQIVVGRLIHQAAQTNIQRPVGKLDPETNEDEEGTHFPYGCDYICNVEMRPVEDGAQQEAH